MNDYDAIDAITDILERLSAGEFNHFAALDKIAYIIGYNKIEHEEQ